MQLILNLLHDLGMTDKEARIYLALYEIGRATAYTIAQRSGLKRPTVHVILDQLRAKGLVLEVPNKKRHLFIVKDPNELIEEKASRLSQIKDALPPLLSYVIKKDLSNTYLFEGVHGIEEALKYKRETVAGKVLRCIYAKSNGKPDNIPLIYLDHDKALAKQRTKIRAYEPDDASLEKFKKNNSLPEREVRVLPIEHFTPDATIEIAADFVRIVMHQESQALIIANKALAKTLEQFFDLLWNNKLKV